MRRTLFAITTRNAHFKRRRVSGLKRCMGKLLLARHCRDHLRNLLYEDKLFNETMELLHGPAKFGGKVQVAAISPSNDLKLVGRITMSRDSLLQCAEMGRRDALRVLGISLP